MGLQREDIDYLKELFKETFVTRQECDSSMEGIKEKVNSEDTRLAVMEHQLKNITWLLMTIGGGVIAALIKLYIA